MLSDHNVSFVSFYNEKWSNEICEWSHHSHITVTFITFQLVFGCVDLIFFLTFVWLTEMHFADKTSRFYLFKCSIISVLVAAKL